MKANEIVRILRERAPFNSHEGLLVEAADTIELLQKNFSELMTNFVNIAKASKCICHYCKNHIECKGEKCEKYIQGKSCWDDARCCYDWAWSCRDFDFGTCDLLKDTPCNGCRGNNYAGFIWRGE